MSVNKVILIGNLGDDPQVSTLPSGDKVVNFSVATTEKWKDRESGERHKHTEWHRVAIYGNKAERAAEWLSKGSKVYIEGSNRTNRWTGDDGVERFTTNVVCKTFEALESRVDGSASSQE